MCVTELSVSCVCESVVCEQVVCEGAVCGSGGLCVCV